MTTYYVATLSKFVLVNTDGDADARAKGLLALRKFDDRWPAHLPIEIRTVRPATDDDRSLNDLPIWN